MYRPVCLLFASALLFSAPVPAAQIARMVPQGEVAQVRQVELAFDADVVVFGQGSQPAPVLLDCGGGVAGSGRWLDARRWTYVFDTPPGPGVSCDVRIDPRFRTLAGEAVTGQTHFHFSTGGPVANIDRPYGDTIAEDQVFALRFNGAVDEASVLAHTHCTVQGLGETVPVRTITGKDRAALLQALYGPRNDARTQFVALVQCKRRLPATAHVRLSIDPGVTTPADDGRRPVEATQGAHFDFTVRPPFSATFSCLRERADKPCTPVSGMALSFSAPIARDDAARVVLRAAAATFAPNLGGDDGDTGPVSRLDFKGPFPPDAVLELGLPEGLRDDADRVLANADQFPMRVATGPYPPLVKFASGTFGVIERFAHVPPGGDESAHPAAVPLTLRNVEPALATKALAVSAGTVHDYRPRDDVQVLRWYARLQQLDGAYWTDGQLKNIIAGKAPGDSKGKPVDTRAVSVLANQEGVRTLTLPGAVSGTGGQAPFQVVGVPIAEPGFHVLEAASPRLGASLLGHDGPMYVRSAALVTNLGVHIKTGRDDVLAWVTTLDDGKPVAGADVNVLDCEGKHLAAGRTDAQGLLHIVQNLDAPQYCDATGLSGLYVSARVGADHPQARGRADFSFALSGWDAGIESWRFNVPVDTRPEPTLAMHTVFDRTLLRAGETVSMKHYIRMQTRDGLASPDAGPRLPDRLVVAHEGSDERFEQPVQWIPTATGGMYATSAFAIPRTGKLGVYSATLTDADGNWYGRGTFRVEAFRLPLLDGHITIKAAGQDAGGALVAPERLEADVQLGYVSGGPAGGVGIGLSGVMRGRGVSFPNYDDFVFDAPRAGGVEEGADAPAAQTLFLDKKQVRLDAQGGGRIHIDEVPQVRGPAEWLFEASFFDPNGQVQTLSRTVPVWPASVQAGLRAGNWLNSGKPAAIHALALSTSGVPQADVPMTVHALARTVYSTRKRMVGGFYSYDHHTETKDLGQVCEGKTDASGMLACEATLAHTGEVTLVATARDAQGRASQAAASLWVTGKNDLWFGGGNDDRIDVIPARKQWKPGEIASFQVRMPYRRATALVAVEREGVLETRIVELAGANPAIELPVKAEWGPNVYVSVLALRGRVREATLGSFLDWGWRAPRAWFEAFRRRGDPYTPPTALVDLAKPSFRFGLAEIRVSDDRDRLHVSVKADQTSYQVRQKVTARIKATLPDGTPAAHGSVAFAAVDEALLALMPNKSWEVLTAMRQLRSYGVQTATAQMEVVGRRHYGRKALPAGGGGGASPTRELLDALVLWEPVVDLDENGQATLTFPLNDTLSRFRLVAIADFGSQRFGTGSTDIVTTQDLQLIPGLPDTVRSGDTYQAMVTLRNSTAREMRVRVAARYEGEGIESASLSEREVSIAPGQAATTQWRIEAPQGNESAAGTRLRWTFLASETGDSAASNDAAAPAMDRLRVNQQLVPSVPVRTWQANLLALTGGESAVTLPVAPPKGALADASGRPRGGLQVDAQPTLGGGLPGVREWLRAYPYTCLEQRSAKVIGLGSTADWQSVIATLPDHLDENGLVAYFPGGGQGSDILTAYLLSASHEAEALGLDFIIPQPLRDRMAAGLEAFVQGRLTSPHWSPVRDLDMRKLAALDALSRYGLVHPRMLDSIAVAPDRWYTSAVIDWLSMLQRVRGIDRREQLMDQASQVLRGRVAGGGTALALPAGGLNDSWWLMAGHEVNQARLMLAVSQRPDWVDDMPRLAQGLLASQREGAWRTTSANLFGTLAMRMFAAKFETGQVAGVVRLALASGGKASIAVKDASGKEAGKAGDAYLPWASAQNDSLVLRQDGKGKAWVSVRAQAAVQVREAVSAGYRVRREITPVSQAEQGVWRRGDVYRVKLTIHAAAGMPWVVVDDAIPAGATILGSGLGRDSAIAADGEDDDANHRPPRYVERGADAYRAYYDFLPQGESTLTYTVRLNTAGRFSLAPTRVQALYQPDVYGELPAAAPLDVAPAQGALP
ncbi:alpha-2-macroglobulin family protein [Paracandidimonas lactea]|uniref:alpha-2-macroglobulin family protein n=1 Tax=Paracandidimonas lactea TaxID=2895524 RepID=UPI001F02CEF2